jgi:putative inorganic carbon (HCO3(-)) transporter
MVESSESVGSETGAYSITTAFAVATCLLVPAYVVRWRVGPLPTTLLENAVLLTIASFVVESWRARTQPAWRTPVTVPAVLFLVAGAIAIFVAPDHRAAFGLYRAYLVEPIAFGLVLVNSVTSPRRALLVVGGLAVGGTIAGLANAAVVLDALRHHAYDIVNTPPVVIYNTANAVALYLVPLVAIASAIALHWNGRRERLLAAGFACVGVLCVLLSFSRGGYLALAVVAIGLAISHRWRWFLIVGSVVLGVVLMQIPVLASRVRTDIDLSNPHNTLVGRFHLWSVTLQMLRDHPLFGAGLSGFSTAIGPYWNPTNIDRYTYPHNIVLNFWTETGILGLVAFAWILIVGFVCAWRGWHRADSDWRVIHLGVLLALVAVVVHGLVDVPYWKNDLSLEFWAVMSLTLAATVMMARRVEPRRQPL